MFSRREVLATAAAGVAMSTAAAAAATFGNPNSPPEGAINANNPASAVERTDGGGFHQKPMGADRTIRRTIQTKTVKRQQDCDSGL